MKPCPSYPGYSVDRNGRVFTHRRRFGLGRGNGGGVMIDQSFKKELNSFVGHGRYSYFSISTPSGQRSIPVHALLLDAFIGPRPKNSEVRHLDGNPKNNSLDNLCYGTVKENADDRGKHGKNRCGSNHPRAKLTESSVIESRQQYMLGESTASLARRHNVSESTMRNAIKGKTWRLI